MKAPESGDYAVIVAGAATIICVWALSYFAKVEIPGYVSSAITTLLGAVAAYIFPSKPAAPPTP